LKAVNIVGYRNSGKTDLASKLTARLKESGLSVSYLKSSSHGFDKPGSDTMYLSHFADKVAGISEKGSFISWPDSISLMDMLPLLRSDFLIIEGGKKLDQLPRVVITQSRKEYTELARDLDVANWGDLPGSINDISSLTELVRSRGFLLPGLNCGQTPGYRSQVKRTAC